MDVVKAEEGEKLDLFCQVGEDLQVDISTWLKNEIEVKSSDRLLVASSNNSITLSFAGLRSSDTAMYTCVFKNLASQASHNIHLFVESRQFLCSYFSIDSNHSSTIQRRIGSHSKRIFIRRSGHLTAHWTKIVQRP